jgi:hypothetical protein
MYSTFSSQLGQFLSGTDADRLVVAMNLTGDQDVPAVQGRTAAETAALVESASKVGLPQTDANAIIPKPPGYWAKLRMNGAGGGAFKAFLDGQAGTDGQRLEWSPTGSRIRMGITEEEDIIDIARGAGAAGLATERVSHAFEM